MNEASCTCQMAPHRTWCPVFIGEQARTRDRLREIDERTERIASGIKLFRSASYALGWAYKAKDSWSAPKALPLEVETGRPSRGADDPGRRAYAAVVHARRAAIQDDADRNGEQRAEHLEKWLFAHFGLDWSYDRIARQYDGTRWQDVWTVAVIGSRFARVLRVVDRQLRERGWME